MSLEAVRIVANGIAANLAAFNELLGIVPRDGDDAPAAITAVYDRTRHGWVARNEIARQGTDGVVAPFLVVTVPEPDAFDPPARLTPAGAFRLEGRASVSVQYVASRARTELAATEASYTLRALRGWLYAFARAPAPQASRTLNGVTLVQLLTMRQVDLFDPRVDQRGDDRQHVDTVVMGGLLMSWMTHEVAPLVPLFDSPTSP